MVISFYAELMLQRREQKSLILSELIKRFDGLDPFITAILEPELVDPVQDMAKESLGSAITPTKTRLKPGELVEGMVVAHHVMSVGGALLVASGRTLTSAIIQRLRLLADEHPMEIEIQPVDRQPEAAGV